MEGFASLRQAHAKPKALICVFYGGNIPFLLRPKNYWEHEPLKATYVHGVMDGEVLRMGIEDQEFVFLPRSRKGKLSMEGIISNSKTISWKLQPSYEILYQILIQTYTELSIAYGKVEKAIELGHYIDWHY
jgi:hypothetical protein